jgi:flagellar hook-basal body complex protein FliE
MKPIEGIRVGTPEIPEAPRSRSGPASQFAETLEQAIRTVDRLQKESEATQSAYARGEDVGLHEVLIKIEQAEIAFKTMMEVRNKLVDAYREVMRIS